MAPDENKPKWHGVLLDPLDVLFFRDGRPFNAANRVVSGSPVPQTAAGAIRRALLGATGFKFSDIRSGSGTIVDQLRSAGADTAILDAKFRGPWFARVSTQQATETGEPFFACPVNLRTKKNDSDCWLVGMPRNTDKHPLAGWNHADGLWPIEFSADPDPKFEPKMLTFSGLSKYMAAVANGGSLELANETDYVKLDRLSALDYRVGIGIDPKSLTTIKRELYGIGLLSLQSDIQLYLEVELPERLAKHVNGMAIPLGGEGKYVGAKRVGACRFPSLDTQSSQTFCYLATPTFLSERKIPNRPLPPESCGKLRAAASERGQAVSGWDVARGGPRGTRFAVPAGAVYFFEDAGKPDGLMEESDQKQALLQEGWGFAIQRTWS